MAYGIGQKIKNYIETSAKNLSDLARQLGVNIDISRTPTITAPGKSEVSNIQQLLGITQTGQVDRNTISTLKQLENEFNTRAGTKEWTGTFVSPSGNIANYDDIIKSFNIINQY
jgi:hypothetical protein